MPFSMERLMRTVGSDDRGPQRDRRCSERAQPTLRRLPQNAGSGGAGPRANPRERPISPNDFGDFP